MFSILLHIFCMPRPAMSVTDQHYQVLDIRYAVDTKIIVSPDKFSC